MSKDTTIRLTEETANLLMFLKKKHKLKTQEDAILYYIRLAVGDERYKETHKEATNPTIISVPTYRNATTTTAQKKDYNNL